MSVHISSYLLSYADKVIDFHSIRRLCTWVWSSQSQPDEPWGLVTVMSDPHYQPNHPGLSENFAWRALTKVINLAAWFINASTAVYSPHDNGGGSSHWLARSRVTDMLNERLFEIYPVKKTFNGSMKAVMNATQINVAVWHGICQNMKVSNSQQLVKYSNRSVNAPLHLTRDCRGLSYLG